MKYLGVILDDHLTFDEHITYILTKSFKKLGILRHARDYLGRKTKILLYKSLILPHLDYCDLVYMCTTAINLQKLQQIQNCACRTILTADNYTPIIQMHAELELLPLNKRCVLHLAMDCFNNINNLEAGLHKLFKPVNSNRTKNTRSSNTKQMEVQNVKTVTERKAQEYRGPNFWNSITTDIRQLECKTTFKKHITKHICQDINHPG